MNLRSLRCFIPTYSGEGFATACPAIAGKQSPKDIALVIGLLVVSPSPWGRLGGGLSAKELD